MLRTEDQALIVSFEKSHSTSVLVSAKRLMTRAQAAAPWPAKPSSMGEGSRNRWERSEQDVSVEFLHRVG